MKTQVGKYRAGSERTHYVAEHWYKSEAPFPLAFCGVAVRRVTLRDGDANCPECRRWKRLVS